MIKNVDLTNPVGSIVVLPTGIKLHVIEKLSCVGCYFRKKLENGDDECLCQGYDEIGPCSHYRRSDKRSVIFKK